MTTIGMPLAALSRRKLRTVLTMLSMAIATSVFTTSASVRAVLGSMLDEVKANPRVTVSAQSAGGTLPITYVEQVKKQPNVQWVFYGRVVMGDDGKNFHFPVVAPMPHSEDHVLPESWRADTQESVAKAYEDHHWLRPTPSLLAKMGWKIGDHITVHTSAGEVSGNIYGTCYGFSCSQPLLFMDFDTLDQMLPPDKRGRVTYIAAGTTMDNMQKVIEGIDESYANSPDPTLTTRADEFTQTNFMREVGSVPVLLEKVNMFLFMVTGIIMMSTLVVSLRERRSQFGVLRVMGFTRLRIFSLIVVESTIVCLLGGLIGAGLPYALFHSTGIHMGGWALNEVVVTLPVAAIAVGASAALGIVIGIIPAFFVVRLDIIKALEST